MRSGPVKLGSFAAVRPSVAGTKFVIPTTNGAINLLDPTTGDLVWSYVVRPVGDLFESTGASNPSGGGSGRPGGGRPGGGLGGGANANQGRKITTLQASGPAVLSGQTLIVPASDGSLLAFDKDLGVDVTPPEAKQVWPTQGEVVSGLPPLQLIFRIEDEAAGIAESTIKVEIDGKEAGYTYSRDGYLTVRVLEPGERRSAAHHARRSQARRSSIRVCRMVAMPSRSPSRTGSATSRRRTTRS